MSILWTILVSLLMLTLVESSPIRTLAPSPSQILCTKPQFSTRNCTNGNSTERFYFSNQCTSFRTCVTEPADNITTFDTEKQCQDICQAPTCKLPPQPLNGFYNQSFQLGKMSLWYRCNKGFRLEGSIARFCMYNNSWSAPEPVCKVVTCSIGDTNGVLLFSVCPANAPKACTTCNTPNTAVTYGCTAYFKCDTARSLTRWSIPSRSLSRECQADGTWSGGPDPYCARVYISHKGKEINSLAIHDKWLTLTCGVEPYLPKNAVIRWDRVDGVNVTQTADGVLTIPKVLAQHAGAHTCTVEVNSGDGRTARLSKTVTISVIQCRNHISADGVLYTGQNTRQMFLSCKVQSCIKNTTVSWFYNNSRVIGQDETTWYENNAGRHRISSVLRIANLGSKQKDLYHCAAQNNQETFQSERILPTVRRLSRRSILHKRSQTIVTFVGKLVQLTTTSTSKFVYHVKVVSENKKVTQGSVIEIIHGSRLRMLKEGVSMLFTVSENDDSKYSLLSVHNLLTSN